MKLPWEEIEELTKYLKEKGLSELTIETKDGKISVKKDQPPVVKTIQSAASGSSNPQKPSQAETAPSKFLEIDRKSVV